MSTRRIGLLVGSLMVLGSRSEEHTSELQSQSNLVCRLLLEKKKLESACPLFASPNETSSTPPSPTPNFFSAARRVVVWARHFVNSSNLFITLLRFFLWKSFT